MISTNPTNEIQREQLKRTNYTKQQLADFPHDIITHPSTPEYEAAHERIFGARVPSYMKKIENS